MKNNLLVMSPSNTYSIYCAITLESILVSSTIDDRFDVIILDDSLTEVSKNLINKVACARMCISFLDVSDYINDNLMKDRGYVKRNTYFRIIAPKLIKNAEKVLYIDCDVIVNYNLRNLFDIDMGDNVFGAVKNWSTKSESNYIRNELHISENSYFNAGILLINIEKFNEYKLEEKALALMNKKEYKFFDQDILNIIAYGNVKIIDSRWNVAWHPAIDRNILKDFDENVRCNWVKCSQAPYIVHYTSNVKPWNSYGLPLSEFFWNIARNSPFYYNLIDMFFYEMDKVMFNFNCIDIISNQYKQGKYSFSEIIKCTLECFRIWLKNKVKR